LPVGWTGAVLGSLGSVGSSKRVHQRDWKSEGIPFFRAREIAKLSKNGTVENDLFITRDLFRELSKEGLVPTPGDVMITGVGTIGVPYIVKENDQFYFKDASVLIFKNDKGLDPRYLFFYIKSNYCQQWIIDGSTGTTVDTLTIARARNIPVPLAPLPEQKRIADKLEAVLGRVDACRTRLDRVPALLKRFRQSVLAAATSGKLTEEWRKENLDVEPASRLLTRIHEKRLALAKTVREKRQIEGGFGEANLSVGDDTNDQENIPDSWLACCIGSIGTVCNGSTPSRNRLDFWDGDIPWVSSGEVRNNIISKTRERITRAGFEGASVRLLPPGTVLLAMIGEGKTRGQSALLHSSATINQNVAAVVLDHGLVQPEYVWRWFQFQYEATRMRGNGSGPQALNCQRVRELPFILPPLPEQAEIVRRVEALFAFADRIEARLATAQKTVERLTPATLAKAFRGDLVPQNPDDEPAAALLARLQQETVNLKPKRRSRIAST
jgi:type I restriction enzyme S subunit